MRDPGSRPPRTPHSPPLSLLGEQLVECRRCPRLVSWREQVAATRRPAYADDTYWGRPVPGFGPDDAALAIVGLAPAAHGANRTGRMFTGDRSGDFLFEELHAVGLARLPTSTSIDDGQELWGVRMLAPVRCAPPNNKPTPAERDACRPWLEAELELLRPTLRAVLVLGAFGWQATLPVLARCGWPVPRPAPRFAHGTRYDLMTRHALPGPEARPLHLIGCYHVSQQNTFTGRLTPPMLRQVLRKAAVLAGLLPPPARPDEPPRYLM